MTFRQYAVFHLHAPDVVRFSQGMWHGIRGNGLFSSIDGRSVSSYHYSSIFYLIAPLQLIWNDPRVFFVAQAAGIATSAYILWLIARKAIPQWAILIPAIFLLNPALHEVATNELRRIIFAMPFITLALWGAYHKRYIPMLIGLGIALLCKENVAIIICMFGFFIFLIHKQRLLGSGLIIFGAASFFFISFCVIPSLHPSQNGRFSCSPESYPQLNYFGVGDDTPDDGQRVEGGESIGGFMVDLLLNPGDVLGRIFDSSGRATIFRVLLPFALIIPLLGWEWFLIAVPSVALMMLSTKEQLHTLQDWYLAPFVPIVTMALIIGLSRIPSRWQKASVSLVVICTLVSYAWWSSFPAGGAYNPTRYELTDHHQTAQQVLEMIPADSPVMAQDAFTAPLALREEIYHLGTNNVASAPFDYLIVDRNLKHAPFDVATINSVIDNLVADPDMVITAESNGLYLFQKGGQPNPNITIGATAENSMFLNQVELAVPNEQGIYLPQPLDESLSLAHGETLRLTIYWEAIGIPQGNRSVSARIEDPTGWIVAQQDMFPSNGQRPTSAWEEGWYFRDVYYLTIPEGTEPGPKTVTVQLYDSATLEAIPFDAGGVLQLAAIRVE